MQARTKKSALAASLGLGLVLLAGWFLWATPLTSQAKVCLRSGDFDSALRWLKYASVFEIGNAEPAYVKARVYRRQGDGQAMERALELAQKKRWPANLIQRQRTLAEAQHGELRRTIPEFDAMLVLHDEEEPEILEAYSFGMIRARRIDWALNMIARWIEAFPNDPMAYVARGDASRVIDQWEAAEKSYEQALKLNPNLAIAHLRLAEIHLYGQDFQRALVHFEQAAWLPALREQAILGQAKCQRLLGHTKAAKHLLGALSHQWGSAELDLERAQLLLASDDFAGADTLVRRSLKEHPGHIELEEILVRILQQTGQSEAAQTLLERVLKKKKSLVQVKANIRTLAVRGDVGVDKRYQFAQTFLDCGLIEEGKIWLQSLLQYSPGHKEASQALQKISRSQQETDTASEHQLF